MKFRNPPPAVVDALVSDMPITAVHEAAHAVAQLIAGLPLHDVSIGYQRRWLLWWTFSGQVRMSPRGGIRVDHGDLQVVRGTVVASLAGPEAEARWLATTTGIPLEVARAQAFRDNRDGDIRNTAALVRHCRWSQTELDHQVRDLVARHWLPITVVAAALQQHRHLTGAAVRTLAPVAQLTY